MLTAIFERYKVPPSSRQLLEMYLRDPLSVSKSVRVQMGAVLSRNQRLFDDCIVAMKEEFQLAKKMPRDVTDYELIASGDFAALRRRYKSDVQRLASSFASDQPAMIHELVERTFCRVASEPFKGEFAFRDGQPTVKQFITHTLIGQWSEMIRQQGSRDAEGDVLNPGEADRVQFEMDTDTGFLPEM